MSSSFRLPDRRALLGSVALAVAMTAWSPGYAQQVQVRDRAELLRSPGGLRDEPTDDETGTDDTHAIASPNDPDLGEQAILKRAENYQPWTFYSSMPISYTSNVALVRTGEEGDSLFSPMVGINYAPRITTTLFVNIGIAQQFFYYNEFDDLDFASFDVRAGLTYILPKLHNLVLRADYNFNRLSATDLGDQLFLDHALAFGAELPFRIGRAQQVSLGADLSFSLAAEPDLPGRNDYSPYVGYSANLTRDLTVSAVARLAVHDYLEGDRTDVSGILAVSANYRFNKWLSANAISTFATSDSNRDVFDYDVANIGGALSFSLRF